MPNESGVFTLVVESLIITAIHCWHTHMAPVVPPLNGNPQERVDSDSPYERIEQLAAFPTLEKAHVPVRKHGQSPHLWARLRVLG